MTNMHIAPTLTEYSFKEKFLSLKNEKRIRRYQFLARILSSALLLYIFASILNYLILSFFQPKNISELLENSLKTGGISTIIWNTMQIIYCYIWYILSIKRANDIGKKIRILPLLFSICLGLYSVIFILNGFAILLDLTTNLKEIMASSIVFGFSIYLPVLVGYGLITLYFLFAPGKSGNNEFGKDPIKTKISFIG